MKTSIIYIILFIVIPFMISQKYKERHNIYDADRYLQLSRVCAVFYIMFLVIAAIASIISFLIKNENI